MKKKESFLYNSVISSTSLIPSSFLLSNPPPSPWEGGGKEGDGELKTSPTLILPLQRRGRRKEKKPPLYFQSFPFPLGRKNIFSILPLPKGKGEDGRGMGRKTIIVVVINLVNNHINNLLCLNRQLD